MRRGDGVEIAREVQVDLFHRHDLRVPAAGRPALHPETGTERGLAQAQHRLAADQAQGVGQADRSGALALPGQRRADRGDQDELALRPVLGGHEGEVELGAVAAEGLDRCVGDADLGGDVVKRNEFRRAGNFQIGHVASSCWGLPS